MFIPDQFANLARSARDTRAAHKAAAILNGKLDPLTVESLPSNIRYFSREEQIMEALNELLECYGVEGLRVEGAWIDNEHGDIVAHYLNTGDAYTETVLYDPMKDEFVLTTYGDWLDEWERENKSEMTED